MADLDSNRIAVTALALADKHGIEGFTMRAVADVLGVTPMALYHHVQDKAALTALVVDAAIREDPLPPPTGSWNDDLWTMAKWMREGTLRHPVVAHLRREYHVWTPAMLQIMERWLALWQQSGLELKKAVQAARMSSLAIAGLMHEEMILRTMKLPDKTQLSWLPNIRVMFDANRDRGAEYELAVRSLVEGMHERLLREQTVPPSEPLRGKKSHADRDQGRSLRKKSRSDFLLTPRAQRKVKI